MIREESSITLKKNAFQSKIRKEWLTNYFQQKRAEFMKAHKEQSQHEERLFEKYYHIISRLPSSQSVDMMITEYEQNKSVLLNYLRQNLSKFMEGLRQVNLKGFNMYIVCLSGVVLTYPEKKEEVLRLSLRLLINQGRRLMKEDRMLAHVIVFNMIELILFLANKFFCMDQLLVSDISDLLAVSLQYIEYGMEKEDMLINYVQTLHIINQFLIASVNDLDEQQDQENFYQNQQRDLDYTKNLFIDRLFIQHPHIINLIVKTLSCFTDDQKLTLITLKMITNLTYYSCNPHIDRLILQSQPSYLIFAVISNFSKKQEIIIILLRLINNLLLTHIQITQDMISKISLKLLVTIFNKQKEGKITLVEEFCEMFSQLICFAQQSSFVINYLIDKNVVQVLLYGLQHIEKSSLISTILFKFPFLIKASRQIITYKIRQNEHIFRKIFVGNSQQQNQQMANYILEQAFKQQNFNNEDKDIQI